MRLIARFAALAAVVAGCVPWGDPGFAYAVRNESASDVIVTFEGRANGFFVPPGVEGVAVFSLGVFVGPIEVLDESCHRRQVVDVTAQSGIVVIDADGFARLEPADVGSAGRQLAPTAACEAAVQPPASGPPSNAAVGPGQIDFTGGSVFGGELWTVATDGSAPERLAPELRELQEPSWTSDGARVVYHRFREDDETDLFALDLATGEEQKLVEDAWFGAWDPSGGLVAFVGGRPADEIGPISILDLGSGAIRQLDVEGTSPTWSPDGRWIAFQVYGPAYIGQSHLWIVPAGGGEARELTTPDTLSLGIAWAPDSQSIAAEAGGAVPSILRYPIDGGSPTSLTPRSTSAMGAAWSPDGRSVAFSVSTGTIDLPGDASLHVLDLETGQVRRLTEPPEFESDMQVAWSSDGSRLAFLRGGGDFGWQLVVVRADGTGAFVVAEGVDRFAWRRDE